MPESVVCTFASGASAPPGGGGFALRVAMRKSSEIFARTLTSADEERQFKHKDRKAPGDPVSFGRADCAAGPRNPFCYAAPVNSANADGKRCIELAKIAARWPMYGALALCALSAAMGSSCRREPPPPPPEVNPLE